jgi:pimeloyl-ACP methyl ester carboxylesterase
VEIYYETYGEGPALIFAHGAGGNHASWWQQVPEFRKRWRTLTFDHRGYGRSRCDAEHFDPRLFPDDLLAILDAEGIERVALVCQSMGGWTGLPFALRHPERVRCLVLCSTPGGLASKRVAEARARIQERLRAEGVRASAALAASYPEREPEMTFLYDQIGGANPGLPPDALGKLRTAGIDATALRDYRVPTLLLACEHDVLFPPEAIHEVAEQIPGARVYDFKGVGHSSYFEDAPSFNRVVGEFLEPHRD